jgi:hypothetical protein
MTTTTLLVRQASLGTTQLRTSDDAALLPGQIRVRVDRFSLTANNITYAAMGDMLSYWQFFPSGEDGWGIVPVWGFGSVVQSTHPAFVVGERLYGYWPMATQAVLTPDRVTPAGFSDAAPHRAGLHAVYNHYLRAGADPFYRADTEDIQALLRPLFVTSWLIDDFLHDQACFGAQRILLSSASSKTAYGTAFQLAQRSGIEVVGLTSAGNVDFCRSLGCYHQVVAYDALESLPGDVPSVFVDMAGSVGLRRRIHAHFSGLTYSCSVGASHVQDLGGAGQLPGPRPVMFFAPAQVKKRNADWGAAGLNERLVAGWNRFTEAVQAGDPPWLVVRRHAGPEATQALFTTLLQGHAAPREGHVASLQPG